MGAVYVATTNGLQHGRDQGTLCMDENFPQRPSSARPACEQPEAPGLPRVSDHFIEDEGSFSSWNSFPART